MHKLWPLLFAATPLATWLWAWPVTLMVSVLVLPLAEWLWREQRLAKTLAWGEVLPRALLAFIVVQTLWLAALSASMGWPMVVLLGLSVGYVSGGSGIVLAHELGHRRPWLDRALARALLTSVGFGHYAIEHNRGHHRSAATYPDPATARFEESLWQFLPRYYHGVFRDAVTLSKAQPGRVNEALGLLALTVAMFVAIFMIAGTKGLVFLLLQALQAQLLVGAVDYMEHWGLRRRLFNARPERMGPQHTWDCANPISDVMLFNLPRHASHHLQPSLNADALFHVREAPQMPTGYAGMVMLALVPPLFRRVMTPRLPQA